MIDDFEREHLKEQMFLKEKEYEELKELEESIRIIMKPEAKITVKLPENEHIPEINTLPF